jgi:protein TonB
MAKATPPKPPPVGIRSASAAADRLAGRRDPRPPDSVQPAWQVPEPPNAVPRAAASRRPVMPAAWRLRLSDAFTIRDPMTVAVFASLLIHGLVLFMRFAPPLPLQVNPNDARLEVVLLNAQTPSRPVKPEVLAQVNQEGGGEHERGRAKSPLPAETAARDGTALQEQRRRIDRLEAQQRQLMTLAKGPQAYVSPDPAPQEPGRPEATDREDQLAVLARMQAEIAKNIEDYNRRPKRLTYGVNAVGVVYARYVADWAGRIERIGTERYPAEARGRQYDSLIITAEIDKHGNVVDVVINKKSKYEALNRAVKQIVYAGQPYERFPPEMAREGDILQIVRTWTFTNNVLETSSLRGDR